jgi:Mannose-6-phosphate isomerase
MIETIIEVKPVFFIVTDLTPKYPAHDGQEPQQAKAVADSRIPFSIMLPNNLNKYTEFLKPPRTITMHSGLVRLNPGQDVGLHSTKQNEEMLVILDGQGEVELEGQALLKISDGQVTYVPPETRHNVRNTGSVPLKYVFIVSGAIKS